MDIRLKTFVPEAGRRFQFLADEYGFVGPEAEQNEGNYPLVITVRYRGQGVVVAASLVVGYMGEEYVATTMHAEDTSAAARRVEIGTATAHTGYQMRRALDRHADTLRELIRARPANQDLRSLIQRRDTPA